VVSHRWQLDVVATGMVPKPMSGIPINWRWWTFHVLCTSAKVKVIDNVPPSPPPQSPHPPPPPPGVLCIKQFVHESSPDCLSFRFDNPKFLEIVVECLHVRLRSRIVRL
jgi:hypothetical protein